MIVTSQEKLEVNRIFMLCTLDTIFVDYFFLRVHLLEAASLTSLKNGIFPTESLLVLLI